MDKTRKHLISLAVLTAISAIVPTATFAQLHLEIAKAPEQAPKIAIIPFTNDNSLYPIIENDLNRSGRFTSASQNLRIRCLMRDRLRQNREQRNC
jgi:TolB protein